MSPAGHPTNPSPIANPEAATNGAPGLVSSPAAEWAGAPGLDRAYFEALADRVCRAPAGSATAERVTLYLAAEASDFLRFNHAAVRQATHVQQAQATIAVVRGQRKAEATLSLTGQLDADRQAMAAERDALRADLALLSDDPYLLLPDAAAHSVRDDTGALPAPQAVIDAVARHAEGLDFVGFYAGGPVIRAFADSLGSRHWHRVEQFHFEWCLYLRADKAVKTVHAGSAWDEAAFAARLREAAQRVALLAQPSRKLAPGAYRALFTPTAMGELLSTLAWSGFGLKARRTGVSSLGRLADREISLHPRFTLHEAPARGNAPAFTPDGFARPASVALIQAGQAGDTLNSPRSAREYGAAANGASAQEMPDSLALEPGTLPSHGLLASLGTGLLVSNLWYLNYSDRQACRMTGMMRYACFWVEGGELAAPLDVMRFDDAFPRMFGAGLVGLGDRDEWLAEGASYGARHLGGIHTPAAVVEGWRLVL
jgi:predicted Zn-dependent protease